MTVGADPMLGVFDRIVCGVDNSPEALEAARQAERLRAPDGLIRLTGVTEINVAVQTGLAMSHALEELDASARAGLMKAEGAVGSATTHRYTGDVVRCLLDEIESWHASLVAVGPHGHSRALGLLLGGVSTALLHDAPCSVLLARAAPENRFPSGILVGVDGSDHSLAAAAVARSIADRFGSELVVVVAKGGKPVDLGPIRELSSEVVTDSGKPVEVLADLSKEVDLLVVGSRGLHGLAAIGSVSERVAHRAACSTLVVRPPAHRS